MEITKLRTCHLTDPVGYMMEPVSLSFQVEGAAGTFIKESRIEISKTEDFSECILDTGMRTDIDPLGFVPEIKWLERTRYYWRVTVLDDAKEMVISKAAFFETPATTINGKWIRSPFEKTGHSVFMKKWDLPDDCIRARLYITGLGLYEAYINGKKVGDEYLTPFYNDYNHWIQFQTFDLTSSISKGGNALGIMLGNGWYKGRFGFIDKLDRLYGDTQQFVCELEMTMADGKKMTVSSDESFACAHSPVTASSIYDGEVYDSRKEIQDWALYSCATDEWDKSIVVEKTEEEKSLVRPRKSLPLAVRQYVAPVSRINTPAGETVIDFGQEISGFVSFLCHEPKDTVIKLNFGEILQDGNFYNENLRTAKEEFSYISNGEERHVRPHFTFYGFRYMKVSGISDVNIRDFTAAVLYSEMEETGEIRTSNEKVNKLIQNALWGQRGNFVDTPTDCPQRDERMGWTGDAQVFCATASFNMYTPAFYDKFLYDMLGEQKENELGGAVPHVVPDILDQINRIMTKGGRAAETGADINSFMPEQPAAGSCAWGDAATIIPWTMYLFYGDKEMLRRQYANMKLWTDYIYRIDEEKCGGSRLWNYGFHFADWLALDNFHKGSCFGGTDQYFVASAFYLHSARLTAKAAEVLGIEADAKKYSRLSDEVREAMQKEYFTSTGRIAIETQTAMVLALSFDIVPDEFRDRLSGMLRQKLEEENVHLTTGFAGTPYLCPALTQNGLSDYAYRLLLNEDYPSWLYEVNMGATTVWERWNSVLPDGHISDTGMNSLNHYAYGSIVEWIYRYVCGLDPSEKGPGFRHFTIKPYPDERLGFARMKYHSACGLIESAWEKTESGWKFDITVPFNTSAEFVLPESISECSREISVSANGESREAASGELKSGGRVTLMPGQYEILTIAN